MSKYTSSPSGSSGSSGSSSSSGSSGASNNVANFKPAKNIGAAEIEFPTKCGDYILSEVDDGDKKIEDPEFSDGINSCYVYISDAEKVCLSNPRCAGFLEIGTNDSYQYFNKFLKEPILDDSSPYYARDRRIAIMTAHIEFNSSNRLTNVILHERNA